MSQFASNEKKNQDKEPQKKKLKVDDKTNANCLECHEEFRETESETEREGTWNEEDAENAHWALEYSCNTVDVNAIRKCSIVNKMSQKRMQQDIKDLKKYKKEEKERKERMESVRRKLIFD